MCDKFYSPTNIKNTIARLLSSIFPCFAGEAITVLRFQWCERARVANGIADSLHQGHRWTNGTRGITRRIEERPDLQDFRRQSVPHADPKAKHRRSLPRSQFESQPIGCCGRTQHVPCIRYQHKGTSFPSA